MIEVKQVTIKEQTFYIKPFSGMEAVKLDRKVIRLLAPALKGLDGFDGEDVNLGALGDGIASALDSLDNYEEFLKQMLKETLVDMNGSQVSVMTQFDAVFQGNILSLYQLLFEIMKHNNFSFFELVGGGGGMLQTLTSAVGTRTKKKS